MREEKKDGGCSRIRGRCRRQLGLGQPEIMENTREKWCVGMLLSFFQFLFNFSLKKRFPFSYTRIYSFFHTLLTGHMLLMWSV